MSHAGSAARRRAGLPWLMPLAIVIIALLLVACGSPGVAAPAPDERAASGADLAIPQDGTEDRDASGDATSEFGPEPPADGGFAAPVEQRIIKTGEITLEVANVAESLGRIRAMVAELNGYVGGSQAGTLNDSATLTVRIPAPSFDDVLARLHELDAEVIAEATREQDVTGQVVDLAARIDNLSASEESYRQLVARAEEIEDILAVQSRLDQVRGEIEQLQAQLDALEGQADLSTLTITLVPKAEPMQEQTEAWNPGAQLDRALASLVGIGQGLLDGLIWFVVVWLPILLVLALLVLVTLRGVLEVRRRLPASAAAPLASTPAGDDATG
ncbi:MAG: DUF4349 domain-containing protein [Candidatus Limnocylindria bacterium]